MKHIKILTVILIILALGLGYAAGFLTTKHNAPTATTAATKERIVKVNSGSAEDALELSKALSEIAALKAEKERLEKALAEATPEDAPPEAMEEQGNRRVSMRERLEELKTSDPERYAEIMKRREEMEARMAQMREERDSFLGSIDVSLMTEEEQANHARYMEMLAQQEALGEQLRAAMESGEEISEEMRQQMGETMREMHQLRDAERTALLNAVGTSMGLSDDEVSDFTSLIEDVMSVTSGGGPGGGGGPRGGGPGGGGPGGR